VVGSNSGGSSDDGAGKPPLLPSWGHFYALVLGVLGAIVLALVLLERHYR